MGIAICSGSYDPMTYGHVDIVSRASKIFGEVIVLVARGDKKGLLTLDESVEVVSCVLSSVENVRIVGLEEEFLLADFCRSYGVSTVVRGLRSVKDLEYETAMAVFNREVGSIDTVYLGSDPRYSHISSSLVREVFRLGGDVSSLVPGVVADFLYKHKQR